jgi:hypothetical protein
MSSQASEIGSSVASESAPASPIRSSTVPAGGVGRWKECSVTGKQGKLKPSSGFLDCNANKISERGRAE